MGLYSQPDKSHTTFGSNFSQPASWIVNQGDRCTLRVTFLTGRHQNFAALVPQRNPFGVLPAAMYRGFPHAENLSALRKCKSLTRPRKTIFFAAPCSRDRCASPAKVAPAQPNLSSRRSAPLRGGASTPHTSYFFGQIRRPGPNHLIVTTGTGGSRVKIGSSHRTSRSRSKPENTPTCDQNVPTDHYSNRLFRHILLPSHVLWQMGRFPASCLPQACRDRPRTKVPRESCLRGLIPLY
jgi:hypothetical protein